MDIVETSVEEATAILVAEVAMDIIVPDVGACVAQIVEAICAAGCSMQAAVNHVVQPFVDINIGNMFISATLIGAPAMQWCQDNHCSLLCSTLHLHPRGPCCSATVVHEGEVDSIFAHLWQLAKRGSNAAGMFDEDVDVNREQHTTALANEDR